MHWTPVLAKENCFHGHEPFKTTKTVRIPNFIWQRVPDDQMSDTKVFLAYYGTLL